MMKSQALAVLIFALPHAAIAQPSKQITNSIGMKFALIPAGSYMMGSPDSEPEREKQELRHKVTISRSYYIGVFEVTQRQFVQVMGDSKGLRAFFDSDHGGGPEHPIEFRTWKNVHDYCANLAKLPAEKQAGRTYRLPTEAEWEYACRAGTTTAFYFGDSLTTSQANFNGRIPYFGVAEGTFLKKTAEVGSYKPNAFGLFDMHGNVGEICADWYSRDYYLKSPAKDPRGPAKGASSDDFGNTFFVVRGGSWQDDARACRSAYRYRGMLRNKYPQAGFRLVCEFAMPAAEDEE
jgi:formylglycine-generating enzyme required for sulfatase activity